MPKQAPSDDLCFEEAVANLERWSDESCHVKRSFDPDSIARYQAEIAKTYPTPKAIDFSV